LVINIPSRNIFANVDWIKSLESKGLKITLICRSANRSQIVKELYFANDENIVSLEGGIKNPNIEMKQLSGSLGLQQILQLVFTVILTCILLASFYINIQHLRYIIISIIFFIVYH
jgi:hypothetical protein